MILRFWQSNVAGPFEAGALYNGMVAIRKQRDDETENIRKIDITDGNSTASSIRRAVE